MKQMPKVVTIFFVTIYKVVFAKYIYITMVIFPSPLSFLLLGCLKI